MAARLDPAERDRRAKERVRRSFSDDAYKHRDQSEPFGSAGAWKRAAGERIEGEVQAPLMVDDDLKALGLDHMPKSFAMLRRAYRLASRTAHPDSGGSQEAFVALGEAYERMKERYS